MSHRRFEGSVGSEYELSRRAIPHNQEMQETLAMQLGVVNTVLELGCGTGHTTALLLDHAQRIVAVDNEPVMLDQARDVLDTPLHDGVVELVDDDILSFLRVAAPNSFDAVVSAMTLHNFSSYERHDIHAEILRVLRPGGLFVNADKYAQDHEKHQLALHWQLKEFEKVLSEENRDDLFSEWVAHYMQDEHPDIIMREDETVVELEELGFLDVEVVYRTRMQAVLVARK